jgi:aspartyl-tRNA synthetase
MERTLSLETPKKVGEKVKLQGWVNTRRDHGGVIFVDLRDHEGIAQVVFNPDDEKMFAGAESLRDEFCISVEGSVRNRGEGLENPNIPTGKVEIVAEKLEILNKSAVLPVATRDEAQQSSEESRLKYRFLDLRRPSMQNLLKTRAKYLSFIRNWMEKAEFTEVVTPILANSSPEGARDFLIPSRLRQGQFYALPQAPQQFKQLLMVAGVPKYYQLAPCFRDEDPRADRLYGEFYQLDLEESFVENGEQIREEMEPLIANLTEDFGGKKLKNREENFTKNLPTDVEFSRKNDLKIPRISYETAMNFYGTDKPDLRYDMKLTELTDVFANTNFKVFQAENIKAINVRGGAKLSRKEIDQFTEIAKSEGAGGLAYLTFRENDEVAEKHGEFYIQSPIAKFMSEEEIAEVAKQTGAAAGDIVFFGADRRETVNKVLGKLRTEFAKKFELADPNEVALCWIVDFPFYEYDEANQKVDFGHNPFSMPKGGLAAIKKAETTEEKLALVADQYDMVMNGYEICSGAVRNHNPEIMYEVFAKLGYSREYVEAKFGAMLQAFKFGAPPHAGCAFGIDRIFMVLNDTENIRDIVAFPKNGQGVDLMMSAPNFVDEAQLRELHVKVRESHK